MFFEKSFVRSRRFPADKPTSPINSAQDKSNDEAIPYCNTLSISDKKQRSKSKLPRQEIIPIPQDCSFYIKSKKIHLHFKYYIP